jgi:CopA family copper-resistance protein
MAEEVPMIFRLKIVSAAILALCFLFARTLEGAAVREYFLTIAPQEVNMTGEPVQAMTINGSIPGPTLRFQEGDLARIHVQNRMKVETSIHWHGILVPTSMDGVPLVTYPPIRAGTTFTYEFPIRQAGTYWYHSHTNLQEQSGVYGSIVIEPRQKRFSPDQDHVILLSDWTDEDPHAVLRTLKRGSDWYSIEKGSGQSIIGAARLGMADDYFKRELQRMPPMDLSDVAYDRFLANGKPESTLPGNPGDTILLRLIDGSSTSFFHLSFAGGSMTIVAADGQDVEPVRVDRFLIGVAETYDILIKIPADGAYELRATAQDGSGFASVWIGHGERHVAPAIPKPNLYHTMGDLTPKRLFALTPAGAMGMAARDVEAGKFDQPGMMPMGSMKTGEAQGPKGGEHGTGMGGMDHSPHNDHGLPMEQMGQTSHDMGASSYGDAERSGRRFGANFGFLAADVSSSKDLALDGMDPRRPWPPYAKLRSIKPTAFSPDKPVREIRLTLDGDMERYVWFINNRPLSESDSILIRKDEIVRFIMINRTMMHHPMHLHGHFFRVINGQGAHAPLKHTVDVAPMSTTVIEFDADADGDWFFHCHLLYHMESGMARVVHYEGFTLNPLLAAVRPDLYKEKWYFWGQADILSNMFDGFLALSDTRNIIGAQWEAGWQKVEKTEWETIFTWERYINRFFTILAGADLMGSRDEMDKARGVLGLRYLLPLNFESRLWVDSDGGGRIDLGKHFQLTPRLALFGGAEYDTHDAWEERVGLSYTLTKNISLVAQWHSDYGMGAGIGIRF